MERNDQESSYEASGDYSHKAAFHGDNLTSVVSLWQPTAQALDIRLKQAAEFVERLIPELKIRVFSRNEYTGLFYPMDSRKVPDALLEMWESGESQHWSLSDVQTQGWETYLAIAPGDGERVMAEAARIREGVPDGADIGSVERAGKARGTAPWPWGKHTTELLEHLAAAAKHWWKNFDPSDNTTAPTNNDVEQWLMARGVARRTAQVMATILRADGIPPGPRT
jgi:hypothetical protein